VRGPEELGEKGVMVKGNAIDLIIVPTVAQSAALTRGGYHNRV